MPALRRLLAHPSLVLLVCLAALTMKLLVPSGYMIASDHGRFVITICPGVSSQPVMAAMEMRANMPGHDMAGHDMAGHDMAGHDMPRDHGSSKEHGKTEMPCAFSSLSAQVLGAVDPILLVAAIAFVMAIGLQPVGPLPRVSTHYLRPPLRGPPALIR